MPPPNAAAAARMPRQLSRLVMQRAGAVALAALLAALALGLLRMGQDIDGEVDAALTLATTLARLGDLPHADETQALAALQAAQAPRHLLLRVNGADGRLLLGPPPEPTPAAPQRWLLALHRRFMSAPDARQVSWALPRPDGTRWTVTLAASHEGERREAMANLVDMLALMLLCVAGLLLAMRWNMRRALAPLSRLLAAIEGIERNELGGVQSLPAMPVRELEALAAALRHLATALHEAERRRGVLGRQLLTLQEDERCRLAAELHDEMGQQLTALRVDTAWLARRLAGEPTLQPVVAGMAASCQRLGNDIRALLGRLQPFGADDRDAGEAPQRLRELLQALVDGWSGPARSAALQLRLQLHWRADEASALQPWPAGDGAAQRRAATDADLAHAGTGDPAGPTSAPRLSRSLALALYRISQEALTNVARHASAGAATLAIVLCGPWRPAAALRIDWSVDDDGVGLADPQAALQRGNGLAGLRERLWALGAELRLSAADVGAARPGLRLAATLHDHWLPAPPADGDRPAP